MRTQEGRRIREAFIAPAGSVIVSADYSQIQLRIMAHLFGDEGLLKAFSEDGDIHTATVSEVFGMGLDEVSSGQRRMARVINFGLTYGMSAFGLAPRSTSNAARRRPTSTDISRAIPAWPTTCSAPANRRARKALSKPCSGAGCTCPKSIRRIPTAAINEPMQGAAADLINLSMISVQGWLDADKLQSRMIMQVHDEPVLEVP